MGKEYQEISDDLKKFIAQQHIYFVATAPKTGMINLSPKGLDSFRVIDKKRVLWLNFTNSGNETAAHLLEDDRMTVMFCSFSETPTVLRLYGHAKAIHRKNPEWENLISHFGYTKNARQIMDFSVDRIIRACGFGVPIYQYVSDRANLTKWLAARNEEEISEYWKQYCQISRDGKPTKILELSL